MLSTFFLTCLKITEISIFAYFFYVSLYNFFLSVAGFFKSTCAIQNNQKLNRIGILIPAYKEDRVIITTVKTALKLNYSKEYFEAVVIADSLKLETIQKLKKLPIKLIEVSFLQSTKVRALRSAINLLGNSFDFYVILDADNLIKEDFLKIANSIYQGGSIIVQGRRIAKNQGNALAVLDDISEQINNHINRKGSCILGGSSSIAGSGFLIKQKIAFEVFNSIDSIGGFDKEVELVLLQQNIKTEYCDSLIVYDEKIESATNFKNQRRRWISSQYTYLNKYFITGLKEVLMNKNFAYFNSAILRNFQLPRLLNLGIFSCICIIALFIDKFLGINLWIWFFLYLIFLISILISIPRFHYNRRTLNSVFQLPKVFITMLLILFRLKGSNESFNHTPHYHDRTLSDE